MGVQMSQTGANIKVIGVGGGGGNAINTMITSGLDGVEFVAVNTDIQALDYSLASKQVQVGKELTKGLGAGSDPDLGRDAALEDRHQISEIIGGADMVFLTAGMGGGTGTGGAPVIAQIAKELGALTVAVVTKPFDFEGRRRKKLADSGIDRLREHVDTLITIPNQRLLSLAETDVSMLSAFKMVNDILYNAIKGISDIINIPGLINVDFADVKTIMASMGQALMGIGCASGDDRAIKAAHQAVSSPLLDDINIEGATGILINITAGSDMTLHEVNQACSIIEDAAHEDANIIFGAVVDDQLNGDMRVTVIATGFSDIEQPSSHGLKSRKPFEPLASQIESSFRKSSHLSKTYSDTTGREQAPAQPQLPDDMFRNTDQFDAPSRTSEPTETETLAAWTIDQTQPNKQTAGEPPYQEKSEYQTNPDTVEASTSSPKAATLNEDHCLAEDIDKKIDEVFNKEFAVEVMEKDSPSIREDDLEIPAFMRKSTVQRPSSQQEPSSN